MTAQDLAAKPAFEAHDVVGLHRAPDRHRWRQGLGRRPGRIRAETAERAMHLDDQSCELVGFDRVMSHIVAGDLSDLTETNPRRPVSSAIRVPPRRLTVAVVVELALRSPNHPRRRFFNQKNFDFTCAF
jgi:hypothetical protein